MRVSGRAAKTRPTDLGQRVIVAKRPSDFFEALARPSRKKKKSTDKAKGRRRKRSSVNRRYNRKLWPDEAELRLGVPKSILDDMTLQVFQQKVGDQVRDIEAKAHCLRQRKWREVSRRPARHAMQTHPPRQLLRRVGQSQSTILCCGELGRRPKRNRSLPQVRPRLRRGTGSLATRPSQRRLPRRHLVDASPSRCSLPSSALKGASAQRFCVPTSTAGTHCCVWPKRFVVFGWTFVSKPALANATRGLEQEIAHPQPTSTAGRPENCTSSEIGGPDNRSRISRSHV